MFTHLGFDTVPRILEVKDTGGEACDLVVTESLLRADRAEGFDVAKDFLLVSCEGSFQV